MTSKDTLSIFLIGDPILDVYKEGWFDEERTTFNIDRERKVMGGAANVKANLDILVPRNVNVYPLYDLDSDSWYKIERYIDLSDKNKLVIEVRDSTRLHDKKRYYTLQWEHVVDIFRKKSNKALVISDYNKGYLNIAPPNKLIEKLNEEEPFEFVITDSRHGSIHPYFLEIKAKIRILHATGNEIYKHDSNDYDYILHTNGAGPVAILKDKQTIRTFDIPKATVVDTTGAGDTFCASIAAYLSSNLKTLEQENTIINATRFAIANCQEVILKLGTAIPKPKDQGDHQ